MPRVYRSGRGVFNRRLFMTTKGESMKPQITKDEKETVLTTEIELEVEELEEVIAPGGGDPGLR
jgi:hypothetical protein